MITPWMIYFVGILDSVVSFFKTMTGVFGASFFVLGILSPMLDDFGAVKFPVMKKLLFKIAVAFFICAPIAAFTPSSKLAAAMYVIPAVANNEDVKGIGSNSLEALRKLSEQWLLELNSGKKENEI